MKHNYSENERVTTALLLAAGTGSRLYPLTQNAPKCLTVVNGVPILERLVNCLRKHGFKRLLVVTGYLEDHLRDFLGDQIGDMKIDYIFSPLYKKTNNIYSLWMARELINEPFMLLESDLVFDESLMDAMMYPDRMAVAKMQPWLNGTCVTVDDSQKVKKFVVDDNKLADCLYKTVNIYSFSLKSWRSIVEKLNRYIEEGRVQNYYETVFAELVANGDISFEAVSFDKKAWYEIDTIEDLAKAEKLFIANDDLATIDLACS